MKYVGKSVEKKEIIIYNWFINNKNKEHTRMKKLEIAEDVEIKGKVSFYQLNKKTKDIRDVFVYNTNGRLKLLSNINH